MQTEEPATRPKTLQMVEVGVETDEPSTRPKTHEFANGETQTESRKRANTVTEAGPSAKQMRLCALYPDSACGYSTSSDEDGEVIEAVSPKNKLRRIKVRRTGAPRPMQAATRIDIPAGARSGFERAGLEADEEDRVARMQRRARTLRVLGLAPPSPITILDDEDDQPQAVAAAPAVPQAAAPAPTPVFPENAPYTQVAIHPPENEHDTPVYGRTLITPFQVPAFTLNLAEFEAFAARRHIDLDGIDVGALLAEIMKRAAWISEQGNPAYAVWPPLRRLVYLGHSREMIALMTLSLYLFGDSELAVMMIFVISKNTKASIKSAMRLISNGRFLY